MERGRETEGRLVRSLVQASSKKSWKKDLENGTWKWERVNAREEESANKREEKRNQTWLQRLKLGNWKGDGRRKRQLRRPLGLRKAGLFWDTSLKRFYPTPPKEALLSLCLNRNHNPWPPSIVMDPTVGHMEDGLHSALPSKPATFLPLTIAPALKK